MSTLQKIISNGRIFSAFSVVLIAVATFTIYGGIFGYPFVFDDIPNIVENEHLRSLSNFASFREILQSRQIVNFTFAINFALGGNDVFGYHLVNILIHILNGIVVYLLSMFLLRGMAVQAARVVSLFAALLFVVHPLQTQAVTYTIQRYSSMAALFYMAAILFYLKARFLQRSMAVTDVSFLLDRGKRGGEESGATGTEIPEIKKIRQKGRRARTEDAAGRKSSARKRSADGGNDFGEKKIVPRSETENPFLIALFFVLAALCALAALLSKENTVSLPLAIFLAEYFTADRCRRGWWKTFIWIFVSAVVGAAFYLYAFGLLQYGFSWDRLLSAVDQFTRETDQVSRVNYLFTQFKVLIVYIRLLFLPLNQNLDYMYPFNTGFFEGATPLAFLVLLVLVFFALLVRKKWPVLSFGVFWFFVTLSVESSVIPIRDALFEHRLYLPLFGFALAISWSIFNLCGNRKALAAALCVGLMLCYGTASFARNRVWQDEQALWADVVRKNPRSVRGYNYLGTLAMEKGQYETAEAFLRQALAAGVPGGDAITHYNLANILKKKGNDKEAEKHYREAIRLNDKYDEAYVNLGNLFRDRGDWASARNMYKKALKIDRSSRRAQTNLVAILVREGDYEEAVSHFKALIKTDPADMTIRNGLAISLIGLGEENAALQELNDILRQDPGNGEAYFSLAGLFEKRGDRVQAAAHYEKAGEYWDRMRPVAFFRVARISAMEKNSDKALLWLERALEAGFRDWESIEGNPVFDALRVSEKYNDLWWKYRTRPEKIY